MELNEIKSWYKTALSEDDIDCKSVGWSSKEEHDLRFKQQENEYSFNDLGCGYGAL